MSASGRRGQAGIAALAAMSLLVAGCASRHFTEQAWAQADDESREPMALDLIASGRLDRLDAREVEALLGEPDYADAGMLVYTVDEGEGYNFYDYLDIRFGADGKVARAFIRPD